MVYGSVNKIFAIPMNVLSAIGVLALVTCAVRAEVSQFVQTETGDLDSDGDGLTDAWEQGYGRYQLIPTTLGWNEAKADAESRGGHLGTITSEAEWQTILNVIGNDFFVSRQQTWLGGQFVQGQWIWLTGEAWSYSRWRSGEPNYGFSGCLEITSDQGLWNDTASEDVGYQIAARGAYLLELGYPTDPFKADTDDDGYNDKIEADNGSDPNDPAATPLQTDQDNDGVIYYREITDGTNPNDATSFNPLSVGMVAYYPFDGNVEDESGYGNNATATNIVFTSGSAGKNGSAAYFDGSAGVTISESPSLHLPPQFAVSAWVNVSTWGGYDGNNGQPIVSLGGVPGSAEQALGASLTEWSSDFTFSGANDYPANSAICWSRSYSPLADISNVANQFPLTKLDISPSQWRLLTWSYDGTNISSYLDGQLLQSSVSANALNIKPYTGWNILRLGFDHGGKRMRGALDGVRIYKRALSDTEISQLYDEESGRRDSDSDDLSEYQENQLGTDPNNPDTDSDGLKDGAEYYLANLGFDPLVANGELTSSLFAPSFYPPMVPSVDVSVPSSSPVRVTLVGSNVVGVVVDDTQSPLPDNWWLDESVGELVGKVEGTNSISVVLEGEFTGGRPSIRIPINFHPQGGQTIAAFRRIPPQSFSETPLTVEPPVSSSGLPVVLSVKSGPATMTASNQVTLTGVGRVVLAANQGGSTDMMAAPEVTTSFLVNKGSQQINFPALSSILFVSGETFPLTATSSSGLPVSFRSSNPRVITVSGSTATVVGRGFATITARQPGDARWLPARTISRKIRVF